MAKKIVQELVINGIPTKLFILDIGDVERDNIWIQFNLYNVKFEGSLGEILQKCKEIAKGIAQEKGFPVFESMCWVQMTTLHIQFTKIAWS